MRLHALLSWFDEPVELLALCIDGLALAGVSHVIALDGRYELFAAQRDVSDGAQAGAINGACRHHGMASTIHVPSGPWPNECVKRTQLFATALAYSDPGDWWVNIDADTIVTEVADDVHLQLMATKHDTALVRVVDVEAKRIKRPDFPAEFRFRGMLFRAQPIVVPGPKHYRYESKDGTIWNGTDPLEDVPALDLTGSWTAEHRPNARPPGRVLGKNQYYAVRERDHVEMEGCLRCDEPATQRVYASLRMINGLPCGRVEELCDDCTEKQNKLSRRWLIQHGLPADVTFHESYAPPRKLAHR